MEPLTYSNRPRSQRSTSIPLSSALEGILRAAPEANPTHAVAQVLMYGRVVRPVLGITLAPSQAVRQLGQDGVLVLEVMPGSPAYNARCYGIINIHL